MKNGIKAAICATLAIFSYSAFAGCASGDTLTDKPNTGIEQGVDESVGRYSTVAYFELERPQDVTIKFETDKIQKVSYKYRVLSGNEYSFRNDTLTVKSSVFEKETAGNKRIRIFVGNKYTEITVRVVSKVIYSVEDFNSIRTNMNGVYVLGNDIDFGNAPFNPIGKPVEDGESTAIFEGIFDGMGHSIKNLTIQARDWAEGEDDYGQGPSLGNPQGNGANYSNGIFMSTGGSAQIINTSFININVIGQGLNAAVAGANGGLIKNCFVSCSLSHGGWFEHSAAIAGTNGSGDAAGRIENCLVVYSSTGGSRGIADWNSGIIKNCYAAVADDYVLHLGYDSQTGKVPEGFDYDDYLESRIEYYERNPEYDNGNRIIGYEIFFGNFTVPAFPGAMDTAQGIFYKGGDIINSDVVRKEYLMNPANFPEEDGWDSDIWCFTYGAFPTLKTQTR